MVHRYAVVVDAVSADVVSVDTNDPPPRIAVDDRNNVSVSPPSTSSQQGRLSSSRYTELPCTIVNVVGTRDCHSASTNPSLDCSSSTMDKYRSSSVSKTISPPLQIAPVSMLSLIHISEPTRLLS